MNETRPTRSRRMIDVLLKASSCEYETFPHDRTFKSGEKNKQTNKEKLSFKKKTKVGLT